VTGQEESDDDPDADQRAEDDQQLGAVATQEAAHRPRLAGKTAASEGA
jgi:hypothetical protein